MSDGKYSVELHVTPLNKNGKWGKRVKNYKVSGLSNIDTETRENNGENKDVICLR